VFKRDAMTSAVAGFGTVFSNTVLLGIPIILTAYGPEATVPLMMIISLHAVTWYTLGTICVEAGRSRALAALTAPDSVLSPSVLRVLHTIRDTAINVATTPIIWGLMGGLLTRAVALPVPPLVLDVTGRLGEAGLPAAIFAMGATLARYELKGQLIDMAMISVLKLVLFPLMVWIIAGPILGVPPLWLSVTVLTAAMPCGVNVYLFANRSGAAEAAASGAVLLSTILGAITLSVLLVVLPNESKFIQNG
jgi:predicted permease